MTALDHDIEQARDLFDGIGALSHRKMFGGAALYADGRIFALIVDSALLVKVDIQKSPELAAALEEEGAVRWTYDKKNGGAPVAMPYWSLPDSAYDDPETALDWARRSLASTG